MCACLLMSLCKCIVSMRFMFFKLLFYFYMYISKKKDNVKNNDKDLCIFIMSVIVWTYFLEVQYVKHVIGLYVHSFISQ